MVFRGIFNNFLFCPSKELWYSNILQNLELCPNLLSKWHFYCIQALEGVQFSKIIKESTYSHLQQKMKSASHGKLMGLRRGTKVPLDSHPSMSLASTGLWLRNSRPIWLPVLIDPTLGIAAASAAQIWLCYFTPSSGRGQQTSWLDNQHCRNKTGSATLVPRADMKSPRFSSTVRAQARLRLLCPVTRI